MDKLEPVFVEFIPDKLEEGKLYISKEYRTSSHNCACGCGEKVVLPFSMWDMTEESDGTISFEPSIGNWQFKCESHYHIKHNKVIFS